MLSYDVEGSRFLDLFSGSGAIGIEALSRGARAAVFVENNRKAARCIRENLEHTHLAERAVLMEENVMYALKRLDKKGEAFSFIFMDPPYGKLLEKEVLLFLEKSSLCDSETRIIVEADLETDFSYLEETYQGGASVLIRRESDGQGILHAECEGLQEAKLIFVFS